MSPPRLRAETREDWIALGTRLHGGFGAFIPIGIRIGFDALQRLDAKPREVTVTYYDKDKSPCACTADGVMVATTASPGQRTLAIAAKKAPAGFLAVVVVRSKATRWEERYAINESWMPKVLHSSQTLLPPQPKR